ncbi:PKD domain-containing protein [Thalassotalea ganghwensis]
MKFEKFLFLVLMNFGLFACGGGSQNDTAPPTEQTILPPKAVISIEEDLYYIGDTVTLSAEKSTDPNQETLSFNWQITDPHGEVIELTGASSETVTFSVAEKGDYTVNLTVNNSKGKSHTASQKVSVIQKIVSENSLPIANITLITTSPRTNAWIELSGAGSSDEDGEISRYLWEVTSENDSFAVEYSDNASENFKFFTQYSGSYQVKLTVEDDSQATNSTTLAVLVEEQSSVDVEAIITGSSQVKQHDTVKLSAESSITVSQTSFSWQMVSRPEQSEAQLTSTEGVLTEFIADKAGEFQIKLLLIDAEDNQAETTYTVTATSPTQNTPPLARVSVDNISKRLGQAFELSAEQSNDPDNDVLTYRWSVVQAPNGANYSFSDAAAEQTEFLPDMVGEYSVSLVVSDGVADSSATTTLSVTNANTAPVVVSIRADKQTPMQGEMVTFSATVMDNENDQLSYQWRLASRPDGSTAELANDTTLTPELYLDAQGDYLVSLAVSDDQLLSNTETVVITARQNHAPPITNVVYRQKLKVNESTTLEASATDPEGQALSYHWQIIEQEEGTQADLSTPRQSTTEFIAYDPGWYTLTVTANDGFQDSLVPWQFVIIVSE